jgi:FMN-dependent NADH-azoreductase
LDLAATPPPHLDFDGLSAGWTPEDQRTSAQVEKFAYRMDLIKKVKDAKYILITTPMFNWGPPSPLKAFIDNIVMPGVMDGQTKSLAGKIVTCLVAAGSGYGEGSGKEGIDFLSKYIETVFGILGSEDVKVVRSEFGYAKFGVTELNDMQIKSNTDAVEATIARAKAI